MQLLLPLAATWLSSVALASDTLEAALMENDECQASGGDEGCTLSALQLRGAKQTQDEESACSPQGQWCGDNYAQKDCCGNNHCARDGGIFRCKPGGAQTTTGWPPRRRSRPPAGPRRRSRSPAERRRRRGGGGDDRRRRQSNQCKQVGQVCGGPGQWQQSCCGNAKCQKLFGGDGTMKCVKENHGGNQCKQVGQVCGGPGQWTQSCCGNAKCQKLFGGDGTMKCVKENHGGSGYNPGNQCKQAGEKCGGPGQQTLTCCRGQCKAEWYNPYGSKTCKS